MSLGTENLQKTVSEKLGQLIGALRQDSFEDLFSEWMSDLIEYDSLIILVYFGNSRPKLLCSKSKREEVHENVQGWYLSGAYLLDPFYALFEDREPADCYRLRDIAPDKFHSTRYFTEYYRDTMCIDEVAVVAYPNPDMSIHVCLGRDKSSNTKFSRKDINTLQTNKPIVSALVQAHWSEVRSGAEPHEKLTLENIILTVQASLGVMLSPRQAEVAMLILLGHSSTSIASVLGLSFHTVKVFRKQLYRKCMISSQAELFSLLFPLLDRGPTLAKVR